MWRRGRRGSRGVWGCCSERYGFPSSVWACGHTDLLNAFTHPSTLSLSLSLTDTITITYTQRREKKNKGLALFLHSLAGDPEAEPGGRETQLLFPAPKPSALANEKRDCPIRFHCGQTTRLSWLRDSLDHKCHGRCSDVTCNSPPVLSLDCNCTVFLCLWK